MSYFFFFFFFFDVCEHNVYMINIYETQYIYIYIYIYICIYIYIYIYIYIFKSPDFNTSKSFSEEAPPLVKTSASFFSFPIHIRCICFLSSISLIDAMSTISHFSSSCLLEWAASRRLKLSV